MGIPTPSEFGDRHKFSIGLLVYVFAVGVGAGAGISMFNYALAEIGGARADFNKEDEAIHREIDMFRTSTKEQHEFIMGELKSLKEEANARMDRKIKNHERISHR